MPEKPIRNVRISDEDFKKLNDKYGSLTLAVKYLVDGKAPEVKPVEPSAPPVVSRPSRGGRTPETWPYPEQVEKWRQLIFPVGELIGLETMALWPISPAHRKTLEEAFKPWAEVGFILVWGLPFAEACRCANSRLQPSFTGDMNVWCEIVGDLTPALDKLKNDTQVLVPLKCDIVRYDLDPLYKSLVDLYHDYFVHYFRFGKPLGSDM